MPKRIAVNTIFTVKDGKRIKHMPGTEVDLSNEELEDIKKMAPDSIRAPINESAARGTPQLSKPTKGFDKADEV